MKNKRKAILLVGALLCLNLNIFSQNIPLKMNKVSVKKAMTELKEKSGYSFVYIAGDLDTKKIVDIDAEQLQEVIEQILEGQNVSYEIKDKNIIIRKKEVEQSMLNEKKLQDISGLVMDVMGEPIVGVNVMERGLLMVLLLIWMVSFYLKLLRMQLLLLVLSVIRLLLLIWKGKRM